MWLCLLAIGLLAEPWNGIGGIGGAEASTFAMSNGTCPKNGASPNLPPLVEEPPDQAMHWVYSLNKAFMEDMIATKGWRSLLGEKGKISDLTIKEMVNHFSGYIIVAVVGLVFVVLVPLFGCLFCCCRCCCCCCKSKGTPSKIKRMACSVCFITFLSMVILALIFTFLASSFVAAQFRLTGMSKSLTESFQAVDRFADQTSEDLWKFKTDSVQPPLDKIQEKLIALPENTHRDFGETSGAVELYTELERYTAKLKYLLKDFKKMDILSQELENNITDLKTLLTSFKQNMENAVNVCLSNPKCSEIKDKTNALAVSADFSGLIDYSKDISDVIYMALNTQANITFSVEVGRAIWDGIGGLIKNNSQETMHETSHNIDKVSGTVDDFVNETADMISGINTDDLVNKTMDDMGQSLNNVAPYVLIALMAMCALPLLIAFCYTNGILFGCCGGPPGKKAGFCNRGKGATCLMCGVSCTFMLTWIVMLIITIIFLVGSITHNELCRHLVNPGQSEDMKYINGLINDNLNLAPNVSLDIFSSIDECAENKAMYTAFNVEELFPDLNITKLLDLSQYGFDSLLDDLTDVNLTEGNVILMNNVTETHLINMETVFKPFDFSKYESALGKAVISPDLKKYAEEVRALAKKLAEKDAIEKELKEIDNITNIDMPDITERMQKLLETTNNAKSIVESLNITNFLPEMTTAQDSMDNEALKQSLRKMARSIYKEIEQLSVNIESSIRCDVGRCQPLSEGLSGVVSTFCVYLLYPVNAFWFGLGWCLLILVIPMLFVAVSLVDQYRACEVAPYGDEMDYPLDDIPVKGGGKNKIYPSKR